MKTVVIGTAGHVDHGKTMLVKALTGIDTDRLKEEKKRGITIESGFAFLTFENGERVGIVDVPGHERFIKNMLAGSGGIDIAMLVVAADEGFMPQTIEHLGILSLLKIKSGLVVLTKCDLADADWIRMMREEIAAQIKGTFLEDAPVAEVSAYTGEGIPALRALLATLVTNADVKDTSIPFRLPIDRVFSMDGFGTVVTGTLTGGQLRAGDEVQIYPSELSGKVRGLQVHGSEVPCAFAGQRTAVNLAGIHKSALARGDVLAAPDSMQGSLMLDVRLELLPHTKRQICSGMRLHLYHGARVQLCKAALLEQESLSAGESGYAQLRLTEPLAAKSGDRFVVRFFSPLETIGGGVILNPVPARHKRNDRAVLEALAVLEHGSDAERVLQMATEGGALFLTETEMARGWMLSEERWTRALTLLVSEEKLISYGAGRYLSQKNIAMLGTKAQAFVREYHKKNPLQAGMRREELRQKLFERLDAGLSDAVLHLLEQNAYLRFSGNRAALPEFKAGDNPRYQKISEELEGLFREGGLTPPSVEEAYQRFSKNEADCKKILEAMVEDGTLVRVSPQIIFHEADYRKAYDAMQDSFAADDRLTPAQLRDLLQTSRKYALALLEYWDKNKVTQKAGDSHILLSAKEQLSGQG